MSMLWQDLRYGLRTARKNAGFTAVAVTCLALGIGANTTIFAVAQATLFRAIPFPESERLVFLRSANPELGRVRAPMSGPDFLDLRAELTHFEALAAMRWTQVDLVGPGEPARVPIARVTRNLFDVLGVSLSHGRGFDASESSSAVLGHGAWHRRFGGDPAVVGDTIVLDGEPFTIIGIASEGLEFGAFSRTEIWLPLTLRPGDARRDERNLSVVGRIAPGESIEEARIETAALAERLAAEHPTTNSAWRVTVTPLTDMLVNRQGKFVLGVLTVAVGFVLLLACANVASLVMARSSGRRRELALRRALGAGRGRLVRQLLAENFWVALLGGALALVVTAWTFTLLTSMTRSRIPLFVDLNVDLRVVAFALLLGCLTPALFGLLPALRAAGDTTGPDLKAGRVDHRTSGRLLTCGEAFLASVLLLGMGVWAKGVHALASLDLGFDPQNVVTCAIELPPWRYAREEEASAALQRLLERVQGQPDVVLASLASHRPIVGGEAQQSFTIEGRAMSDPNELPWAAKIVVTPEFFSTLRVPLLHGRYLEQGDGRASGVAVVSHAAQERYWAGADPVGERIALGADGASLEIVGVVADLRNPDADQPPEPHIYVPLEQEPMRTMALLVRTRRDPEAYAATLREVVTRAVPGQPAQDVRTLEQILYDDLAGVYVLLSLGGYFAVLALMLAVTGIYGVVSFLVSQRIREFGVRMALGAETRDVLRLVVGRGLVWACFGIAGAVGAALLVFPQLRGGLYGVSSTDPVVFVAAPVLVIATTLMACLVPALRAARVDPVVALHAD